MKTIRFVLMLLLCNLFFFSPSLASIKTITLFPGLANEKIWNNFVVESTKLGKVNAQGILTDFLAEGSIPFLLDEQNELSAVWRKAMNPEMLQEIKAGKYENYFQFFREFNKFGERIPLVTLKQLVSIKEGERGIFAPMHQPIDGEQKTVETKQKVDIPAEVVTKSQVVKPIQKPEKDIADQFSDNILALQKRVDQLLVNQGNSREVTALKAQVDALKAQLKQLTNNQQDSTKAVQELRDGIKDVDTQLKEFSGDVSDLSSLVTSLSNGVQARFAELEGKIPNSNSWQIIVVGVLALISLLIATLAHRKKGSDNEARLKAEKKFRNDWSIVKGEVDKTKSDVAVLAGQLKILDAEVLQVSISSASNITNANKFFINDEKSLTSKTLADLAVGKTKHVTVQVGDSALEVSFERKSETDVLVHGIKRHESATEAMILVSVSTNPARVIRNAVARHCLVGAAVVNLSNVA